MEDRAVCSPHFAESGAQSNTTSTPIAASVTDAKKVINTKIDIAQVEENGLEEEELLKGLLTDDYCHVCEAVLKFESQRISHYEGKKHGQKLKVYLQAKRDEKMHKLGTGSQQTMTTDKDRFCELCNMVFSSSVVAKSHYEGKVHSKNLRKQGLHPQGLRTLSSHTQAPANADQNSTVEGKTDCLTDPADTTVNSDTEVDLTDSNKHCLLCAATFNSPQMALQHYNGRKHQRNQARQELLRDLGGKDEEAGFLMCQVCSTKFDSVEMYHAHMQGNKHQTREKKVIDLCKSQQKVYSSFADELADYIQVQKARGITPKTTNTVPLSETQQEDEEEEQDILNMGDVKQVNNNKTDLNPISNPIIYPNTGPGCYFPVKRWHLPYKGPPWPTHGPPAGSASPQFTSHHRKRRCRRQSSSSSYTASSSYSSSYSSSSSSTSDSDSSGHRDRQRRRIRRSRTERARREQNKDLNKEDRRRQREKRIQAETEERRREDFEQSDKEKRREKHKPRVKHRKYQKKSRQEHLKEEGVDSLDTDALAGTRREVEEHIQAEINVAQLEGVMGEPTKPKYKKEKKKTKEKVDTRTEEEKLWDDSILGC